MKKRIPYILLITTLASACTDNGDDGFENVDDIYAVGAVTGFGSVLVNGITFTTGDANIVVDEREAGEGDLAPGMVVTVVGEYESEGSTTAEADQIVFDEWVQGPIVSAPVVDPDGQTKDFTVFNHQVRVDRTDTVMVGVDFASLTAGDVVEVSGFFDHNNMLYASRLVKTGVLSYGSTEVEIEGWVFGLSGTDAFVIGDVLVTFGPTTDIIVPGGLRDNVYVEVIGTLESENRVAAQSVSVSDGIRVGDLDLAELQGFVTTFGDVDSFTVNGRPVNAENAQFVPASLRDTLATGVLVEVEGELSIDGVLRANRVVTRRGAQRIAAVVASVDTANAQVSFLPVQAQPQATVLLADSALLTNEAGELLALASISSGDFLEAIAYQSAGGNVATRIQRRSSGGDVVLLAPLEALDPGAGTVTVLGVTFQTDPATTVFEDDDTVITRDGFFAAAIVGRTVRIRDSRVAGVTDGVADEVELEGG